MVRKIWFGGLDDKSGLEKDPRHEIRHDLPERMLTDSLQGSRDIAVTRLGATGHADHWQQTGQAAKASHVLRLQPPSKGALVVSHVCSGDPEQIFPILGAVLLVINRRTTPEHQRRVI